MRRKGKSLGHRSRSRFAIPTNRCVRGQPIKGQIAPWYLKHALSRPAYKRRQLAEVA